MTSNSCAGASLEAELLDARLKLALEKSTLAAERASIIQLQIEITNQTEAAAAASARVVELEHALTASQDKIAATEEAADKATEALKAQLLTVAGATAAEVMRAGETEAALEEARAKAEDLQNQLEAGPSTAAGDVVILVRNTVGCSLSPLLLALLSCSL